MNYYIDKTRIIISTIALAITLTLIACDRYKYSKDDVVTIIDISEPCVEKHAKRGIEISEEERKEIVETINKEGLLNES